MINTAVKTKNVEQIGFQRPRKTCTYLLTYAFAVRDHVNAEEDAIPVHANKPVSLSHRPTLVCVGVIDSAR